MRLIDADALADDMMKADMPPHDIGGRYQTGFMDARSMAIAAPTIDPVKHGKWYITEDMPYWGHIQEYLTCSACEGRFRGTGVEEWDYCPNCGAKMDGGEG